MSVIETLRSVAKPAAITVAAIEVKLRAAQNKAAALEGEYGAACLDAVAGIEGGSARLDAMQSDLARARGDVKTLEVALGAARDRDQENLRKSRVAMQKTQLAACRTHLRARDEAAEALSAALAEAAKHWRVLVERSAKAEAANPIGGNWPDGAICSANELFRPVQLEMARLCALAGCEDLLPGVPHVDDAIGVTPLLPKIKEASAQMLAVLTKRVSG